MHRVVIVHARPAASGYSCRRTSCFKGWSVVSVSLPCICNSRSDFVPHLLARTAATTALEHLLEGRELGAWAATAREWGKVWQGVFLLLGRQRRSVMQTAAHTARLRDRVKRRCRHGRQRREAQWGGVHRHAGIVAELAGLALVSDRRGRQRMLGRRQCVHVRFVHFRKDLHDQGGDLRMQILLRLQIM